MSIISLVIVLVVLGLAFYLVEQLPLAAPFPVIIKVVAILIGLFIILQFFGVNTGLQLNW